MNLNNVATLNVNGSLTASAAVSVGGGGNIGNLQVGGTLTMTVNTLSAIRGNGGTLGSVNSGGSIILEGSSAFNIGTAGTATYTVASGGTLEMDPSALVNGSGSLIVASGAI